MVNQGTGAVVLKILTGVQAGIDVALVDGSYTVGSGNDDDIQIYDVSLRPGHARLKVAGGKVEIAGAAGALRTAAGADIPADGEFQVLEPLDVVSAGTTRFATGLANANWASITEDVFAAPAAVENRRRPRAPAGDKLRLADRRLRIALPAAAAALVLSAGAWMLAATDRTAAVSAETTGPARIETVRNAVQQFPFGQTLDVKEEVDGVIFVTGFVEQPVERRAILNAVRDVDDAARVRLVVLASARQEIAALIEEQKANVDFTLDAKGDVVLKGVLLDPKAVERLGASIGERVSGLSSVTSQIRTAPTLLADVEAAAERSRIRPFVLFRLDGALVEASGVLPVDKIDPWVGFLQSYSKQFADLIPLRSLVSLQNADGTVGKPGELPSDRALVIGKIDARPHETPLDVARIANGNFDLGDVFVNKNKGDTNAPAPATAELKPVAAGTAERDDAARPDIGAPPALASLGPAEKLAATAPSTAPIDLGSLLNGGSTGGRPLTLADSLARPAVSPPLHLIDDKSSPRIVGKATWTPTPLPSARQAQAVETGPADDSGRGGGVENASGVGTAITARSSALNTVSASTGTGTSVGLGNAAGLGATAMIARHAKGGNDLSNGAPQGTVSDADTVRAAAGKENDRQVRDLIRTWADDQLPANAAGNELRTALDTLQARPTDDSGSLSERYAPLQPGNNRGNGNDRCWKGSSITVGQVRGVVFWLDVLSVSENLTLASLDPSIRAPVLEAAVNPYRVAACAERARGTPLESSYLAEIERNPGFVNFITRDLQPYALDIAGADLTADRYVQTRTGTKLREGAAPDRNSRIASVGDIGLAIENDGKPAAVIFGPSVNWFIR